MSKNFVITLAKSEIEKLKQFYATNRVNSTAAYIEFMAKMGTTTITVYTSGKVMFQGNEAQQFASQWQKTPSTNQKTKRSAVHRSNTLPENFDQLSVVGSDEVGNGSYFGPITVCATYVDKQAIPELKALGVKDSKELTDAKIRQLSVQLKQRIPHKLLTLEPKKYNQIQPKYNAVHMKVALHNQAIFLLLKQLAPLQPEAILIDQFTPEKNYKKYVKEEEKQFDNPIFFATKGEQYHLAVAAASILCRATFLEELELYSKEVGVTLPSGAGKKSDQVAAQLLKKGGLPLLTKYAKLHFANTKKAQKLAGHSSH